MSALLNASKTRAYALEIAERKGRPITRVSRGFLARADRYLRDYVEDQVHRAPGKKTLE